MSYLGRSFISLLFLSLPAFAGSPAQQIRNFFQVDGHVYRGGQPTDEGFNYLAKIGVKTVVDLREQGDRSLAEEHVVAADGMQYVNVPMTGLTPPSGAQITKILALLEDDTTGPVFVHCLAGSGPHRRGYRCLPHRPRSLGQCSGSERSQIAWHELFPISPPTLHPYVRTPGAGGESCLQVG